MRPHEMDDRGVGVLASGARWSSRSIVSCILTGSLLVVATPALGQTTASPVETTPTAPSGPSTPPATPPLPATPPATPPFAVTPQAATTPPATPGSGPQNNPPANNPPANNPPSVGATPPAATAPPAVFRPATPPAKVGVAPPPPAPIPTHEEPSDGPKRPRKAQIGITWDLVVPIRVPVTAGSEAGMMSGTSVQGFSLELRYWLKDRLAVGALVAWHTFSDKKSRTLELGDSTQTGLVQTDINSNEILARVTHALADRPGIRMRVPKPGEKLDISKQIIPFVSAGLGATRYLERFDTGLSVQSKESWYVAIVPEIGIEIPTKLVPVIVAGRLHYFFASSGNPDQVYATFSLGAGFD